MYWVLVTQLIVKNASEDTLQPYYINACIYDMIAATPSPYTDGYNLLTKRLVNYEVKFLIQTFFSLAILLHVVLRLSSYQHVLFITTPKRALMYSNA